MLGFDKWGPWSSPIQMYNNDFVQVSFRHRDNLVRSKSITIGISQENLNSAIDEISKKVLKEGEK